MLNRNRFVFVSFIFSQSLTLFMNISSLSRDNYSDNWASRIRGTWWWYNRCNEWWRYNEWWWTVCVLSKEILILCDKPQSVVSCGWKPVETDLWCCVRTDSTWSIISSHIFQILETCCHEPGDDDPGDPGDDDDLGPVPGQGGQWHWAQQQTTFHTQDWRIVQVNSFSFSINSLFHGQRCSDGGNLGSGCSVRETVRGSETRWRSSPKRK